MNDDLPEGFQHMMPQGAPAELRPRALTAVSRELARQSTPRWERMVELAVAASLALGVGLNVWCWRAEEGWQMRVYGPVPIPSAVAEVARTVTSITDSATGEWIQRQLSSAWTSKRSTNAPRSSRYEQLLNELTNDKVHFTL
ncbi:MAG: hypothetical protein HY288_09275 [Planctomycetia bacterium]|nr:hypothetical protein [Planctomycetia bacterium]